MQADTTSLSGLKEEGNKLFGRKDYQKALDAYEAALKLTPEGHPDKALLHSNKAACYMMFKRCCPQLCATRCPCQVQMHSCCMSQLRCILCNPAMWRTCARVRCTAQHSAFYIWSHSGRHVKHTL